jgi:hypothetical protein
MRYVALILLLSTSTAFAQIGQFPGVAPPVPSPYAAPPQLGGAPAPPTALSVPSIPSNLDSGPSVITRRARHPVLVPGGPSDFSSRVERCVQAGTEAGVRPGEIGRFTGRCVQ